MQKWFLVIKNIGDLEQLWQIITLGGGLIN